MGDFFNFQFCCKLKTTLKMKSRYTMKSLSIYNVKEIGGNKHKVDCVRANVHFNSAHEKKYAIFSRGNKYISILTY